MLSSNNFRINVLIDIILKISPCFEMYAAKKTTGSVKAHPHQINFQMSRCVFPILSQKTALQWSIATEKAYAAVFYLFYNGRAVSLQCD
jgi:hypothetical protein